MTLQSREFEVRLLQTDGTLSVIMKVSAVGPAEASDRAKPLLKDGISHATIWFEGALVTTIYPEVDA